MSSMAHTARAVALASLLIAVVAATAAGETFELEPSGTIEAVSSGQVTYESSEGGVAVECDTTLGGEVEAGPIEATSGSAFGELTSAATANCAGGTITPLEPGESPWQLQYEGIEGTLPDVLSDVAIRVRDVAFEAAVTILGFRVRCLYGGTALAHLPVEGAPQRTSSVELSGNALSFVSGSGLCPRAARADGSLTLEPSQLISVAPNLGWLPENPLDFRGVTVRTSRTIRASMQNTLMRTINITARFSPTCTSPEWTITGMTAARMLDREFRAFEVTFEPQSRGSKICDITIENERGNRYVLPMYGIGT